MKKAYLLLVHKNPAQINILISQLLKDENADIYIHINKLNDNIRNELKKDRRVFILCNNINVYWGNESINKALMLLLRMAINSNVDYKYYSFRTGQELQIRDGIDNFLKENEGKIFLNPQHIKKSHIYYGHFSINWPEKTRCLYENKLNIFRIYRKCLLLFNYIRNNLVNTKNALPDNMELYWGRFWGFFPKDVAHYIINYYDKNSSVLKLFHKALVPEEMFLHTIIMNSHFSERVMFDDLCLLVGHKNNHPTVVTNQDIHKLENSKSFFARKFDIEIEKDVVNYFKNKILNQKL